MTEAVIIPLSIETQSPCLWSAGEPMGNATVSHDFVPGSVVRGWAAWRFIDAGGDPDTSEFRDLFLRGAVRFSDLRPEGAVRAPLSLYECKRHPFGGADAHPVVDRAAAQAWGGCATSGCGSPMRRVGGWLSSASGPASVSVAREVSVHNTIDPERKRPHGAGGVYSLDCISAGQSFAGGIVVKGSAEELLGKLGLEPGSSVKAVLGRGRANKGLGQVRVTIGEPRQADGPAAVSGRLTLDFLSRTILRGADGQPVTTADGLVAWVRETLGIGASVDALVFADFVPVPGFSGATGLPRSTDVAVSAGSVVVLDAAGAGHADAIAALLASGAGERVSEGFGEVALGHAIHTAIARGVA